MKTREHLRWIDVAKGIGILLVVIGHVYDKGAIKEFIYLFHMPLFFYIAGYLYRKRKETKRYFYSKLAYLGVPYVVYAIILYFILMPINPFNHSFEEIINYINKPLLGGKYMIGVFWFITVFFMVQQLYNLVNVYTKRNITVCFIAFVSLVLSYANSLYFKEFWLLWNSNVVLAVFPFVFLGGLNKIKPFNKTKRFCLYVTLVVLLPFLIRFEGYSYDFKYTKYGVPILTFYASYLMVLLTKDIAVLFSRFNFLSLFFSSLGKSSMVIMYVHLAIRDIFVKILGDNHFLIVILTTIISFMLYRLFSLHYISRALLVGSNIDLINLRERLLNFKQK
ncbi:acyltransferase family protein [Wenyingzhuangia sp. IMCC45574]